MALPLHQFLFVKGKRLRGWNRDHARWAQQLTNVRWYSDLRVSYNDIDDIGDYLPVDHSPQLHDTVYQPSADTIGKEITKGKLVFLRSDIKRLDDRQNLHCENEPAYISGKIELYFLHGVHIEPRYIHLVQVDHPDPKEVLTVKNVDVRRELIRRVGIEQFVDSLWHKVIDSHGDYVLLDVLLNDSTWSNARFLKMLNPSIGVWHLEGVPNNVQTVEEALTWRNNGWFAHASILT